MRSYMTIRAAAPALRLGDCAANGQAVAQAIREAHGAGAGVLALPRLALTGASCGDLFALDTLCRDAEAALEDLLEQTRDCPVLAFIGLPVERDGLVYEAYAAVCGGQILAVQAVRGQAPFAAPPAGRTDLILCGEPVSFGPDLIIRSPARPGLTAALDPEALTAPCPAAARLASAGATLILCPAAEPESLGAPEARKTAALALSDRLHCAIACSWAGPGESVGDGICGGMQLLCEAGELLAETAPFCEDPADGQIDLDYLAFRRRKAGWQAGEPCFTAPCFFLEPGGDLTRTFRTAPWLPEEDEAKAVACRRVLELQARGLARRLEHTHSKTAVLGISGGLDSTLALAAAARAMDLLQRPRTDLVAVTMPGFGTTDRTKNNAFDLCRALGVTVMTVDIRAAVAQHFADIGQPEELYDVTYENAQARERTQVLMDLANRLGGLVVGTGDLSELALGWATYNGDHMSMYGLNAGLPKTVIRAVLDRYASDVGGQAGAIIRDILDTPVSPELLPAQEDGTIAQKTEDLVGPYDLHDFFLWGLLVRGWGPADICAAACRSFQGQFDRAVILYWLRVFFRRFFQQQFKRSCLPEGPAVLGVSLSPRAGFRMPSDLLWSAWQRELEALI